MAAEVIAGALRGPPHLPLCPARTLCIALRYFPRFTRSRRRLKREESNSSAGLGSGHRDVRLRADGRTRLGGRLAHQQRQHATIDGAGPAVWRALRFRLQARRHRHRNLKADRWPGCRPRIRCHLQ